MESGTEPSVSPLPMEDTCSWEQTEKCIISRANKFGPRVPQRFLLLCVFSPVPPAASNDGRDLYWVKYRVATRNWQVVFRCAKLSNKQLSTLYVALVLTSLVQVIFGTGLPEASHSRLTSVPFFTTMLPSAGRGFTRGGTEMNEIKIEASIWSTHLDLTDIRTDLCPTRCFGPLQVRHLRFCRDLEEKFPRVPRSPALLFVEQRSSTSDKLLHDWKTWKS